MIIFTCQRNERSLSLGWGHSGHVNSFWDHQGSVTSFFVLLCIVALPAFSSHSAATSLLGVSTLLCSTAKVYVSLVARFRKQRTFLFMHFLATLQPKPVLEFATAAVCFSSKRIREFFCSWGTATEILVLVLLPKLSTGKNFLFWAVPLQRAEWPFWITLPLSPLSMYTNGQMVTPIPW